MKKESYETSAYRYLVDQAMEAVKRTYSPYSHFGVGAALEDQEGRIWLGCNIENAAYGPTICAERTAIFKAVSEGVTSFRALAIVAHKDGEEGITEEMTPPCGVCRQVLSEFCSPDMPVVLANRSGEIEIYLLEELLPLAFKGKNLK